MKEMVSRYWKTFSILSLIIFWVFFPKSLSAETCTLGQASLNTSSHFLRFGLNSKECKQRKKLAKKITLSVSGDEAVSIESSELHSGDDGKSDYAFKIRNNVTYGLRPGDSTESEISFQPTATGSYSSTLMITFGYANESLGPYRECLVRTFGFEVIRKRDLLEKFKQKGVDLSVPNQREVKTRSDFNALKAKLIEERTNADHDKFKFEMEKAAALEDLRKGLFCDQCHWSKTRIKNEKHEEFEDHLKRVKGNVEPAPQKVIDETLEFYNSKIKEAAERSERANSQLNEANKKYVADLLAIETMKQQLIEAFNRAVALLTSQHKEAQKRADDAMKLWEKKKQTRQIMNISIEGECNEE